MPRSPLSPWGLAFALVLTLGCSSVPLGAVAQESVPTPSPGQMLPIEAEAQIKDRVFQLEVARTPRQQQIGLMFRTEMAADRGMLFPYDPPAQPVAFWMYNTLIPLDIIFLYQGEIVHIAANVPGCAELPCPSYGPDPDQLVDQVVELNGGTAADLGLTVGDGIEVRPIETGS